MFSRPANVLAWYYHLHHRSYVEDLPFWFELAGKQDGPILELGCGTGRVLLKLAQAGYPVFGMELDSGMLAVLRQEQRAYPGSGVHLVQADMRAYRFGCQFPLILLPCNTYSTFPASQRQAILANVRANLASGGCFVASLPNPTRLVHLPSHGDPEIEVVFNLPSNGDPVQVSSSWERQGRKFYLSWHYDHLLPDGRVDRLTAQTCHYLDDPRTYLGELPSAGLQLEAVYGDFERADYDESATELIVLARRVG